MSVERHSRSNDYRGFAMPKPKVEKDSIPTWISDRLAIAITSRAPEQIRSALEAEPANGLMLRLSGRFAFLDYLVQSQDALNSLNEYPGNLSTLQHVRDTRDTLFDDLQTKRNLLEETLKDQVEHDNISLARSYLGQASDDKLPDIVRHFLQTHSIHVYNRSHPELLKEWATTSLYTIIEHFIDLTSEYATTGQEEILEADVKKILNTSHQSIQNDIDAVLIIKS